MSDLNPDDIRVYDYEKKKVIPLSDVDNKGKIFSRQELEDLENVKDPTANDNGDTD